MLGLFSLKIGRFSGSILLGLSGVGFLGSLVCWQEEISWGFEWSILSHISTSMCMLVYIDWMACVFASTVGFISGWVLIYSDSYMFGEKYLGRFTKLVLMFVLSMMLLIFSPNLLSMLLGWDGLGLVSYCLVIYYQNPKAFNAGMLTALTNRVGDVMLLMGAAWWLSLGGWNYMYYITSLTYEEPVVTIVGLLVMVAAMTKSAQIPFSAWLPAAMAAPTPVSALVHSSTLVTAGVYLLIRFQGTNEGSFNLTLLACLTMFMAGLGANFETDLKKVVALSTLSQLGLMMATLGVGLPELAFFHLITHALFKALMFLCAGSFIHALGDNQDIRKMGGLGAVFPGTTACFLTANMALCGFPFLAGFYSKDLILETIMIMPLNLMGVILFFLATGLTVSYTMRLIGISLVTPPKGSSLKIWEGSESGMLLPMMALSVLATTGGAGLAWMVLPTPLGVILPNPLKALTTLIVLSGVGLGWWVGKSGAVHSSSLLGVLPSGKGLPLTFGGSMWFMPQISGLSFTEKILELGGKYFFTMDQGWGELGGGQGFYYMGKVMTSLIMKWDEQPLKVMLGALGVSMVTMIFLS
uniref:NADH-ubiquinone oxidoreductase chain 5 n=1 Tax=Paratimomenus flavocapitatus TaxID=2021295 RepID=A0A678PDP0_9NEOP|nr:NADH dehydrogenase subunit 5 [Paratimomenus flavocapitatus]